MPSNSPPKFESDFVDKVTEIVQSMIEDTMSLPPQLFLYTAPTEKEQKPGICVTRFPVDMVMSGAGKDVLSDMLKDMLKTKPSDQVVFVTEAWSCRRNIPKELEKMLIDQKIRLSQLPSKFRQEVIMMQYYDARGAKTVNWMGKREFERDPEGNIIHFYDTEWTCMSVEGSKVSGRFTNLMD